MFGAWKSSPKPECDVQPEISWQLLCKSQTCSASSAQLCCHHQCVSFFTILGLIKYPRAASLGKHNSREPLPRSWKAEVKQLKRSLTLQWSLLHPPAPIFLPKITKPPQMWREFLPFPLWILLPSELSCQVCKSFQSSAQNTFICLLKWTILC